MPTLTVVAPGATAGAGEYTTIAAAITAAAAGDTINIAAGDFNQALTISKSGLTIVGAVDANGDPTTIVGGAAAYSLSIMDQSNISVSNIKVKSPSSSSAYFMMHISGTTSGATGIQMTNVVFDDSVEITRGASVNHAAVTFTNCKFPKTKNYSLGIASSQGVTCTGCIFKQSGWGTIGIFPSNQTKAATGSVDLRTNNTFENTLVNVGAGAVIGSSSMGLINIQPNSAPSVTNGTAITFSPSANDVNVKLPSSFIYAYYETAAHTGTGSVTVSNTTEFYSNTVVQTAYSTAFANIYSRNLSNNNILVYPGFSIPTAMNIAVDSDTVELAAGSYSGEQLTISKAITVKGAGMSQTTYTHTGGSWSVLMNKSGAILRDIKILKPHTNTTSVISVARESRDVDSTGCKLINVQVGSSTSTALARSVDINGVSDVTVQGCVFSATTASYTLGLASVKGITVSGCTIPASAWGSVGIFTTTNTAYGSPLADTTSSGIDLSTNTWSGAGDSGVINIQPNSYASYKLAGAAGSAVVTLPSSFRYAYLQQVRSAANADVGSQNVSISNVRFMADTTIYGMVQAAAAAALAGSRIAMFGRDLADNNKVFFDATFNNAENQTYGGATAAAEVTTTLSSSLTTLAAAPAATAAEVTTAVAAAASSTISSINYATVSTSEAQALIKTAAAAVLAAATTAAASAASGSAAAAAPAKAAIELVKAANESFKNSADAIGGKAGVAEAVENLPPATMTSTEATELFNTLKPENVDSTLTAGKAVEFIPAKSVVVGGVTKRYIIKPSAPSSSSIDYTPMIPGEWYNLLLDTEVVGGVPTEPAGETISQLKYESDKLYFRDSSSASSTEKALADKYTIVRSGVSYPYDVCAIGSTTSSSSGVPCIPAGQRILTAAGWRAVEELRNGDMVITDTGAAVPAKIYSSTVITTSKTAPINIPASMFGKSGAPVRLSPLHAVRLSKGIWEFPYNLLRSRAGVTQDTPGATVTYYHIALPNFLRDNLVLEGGVVAESYGAPFVKANGLKGVKLYTYSERLGGYTRMAPGAVAAGKSKTA